MRELIKTESVRDVQVFPDGVGYVQITQFTERTGVEFVAALNKLAAQNVTSLVVDLRNPQVAIVTTDERATLPRPGRPGRYRWTKTSSFARATGAEIAINANYYDIFARRHSACGLTVSAGHWWRSTYRDGRLNCDDSIGFGSGGRAAIFDSSPGRRPCSSACSRPR